MDVKEFQSSRQKTLDDFNKQYNFLKTAYSESLLSAIQEQDPQKQDSLIQNVLQTNSTMTQAIREIITDITKSQNGFDPKTLDELTNDLVQYQTQYQDIQQGKDRYNTLKLIQGSTYAKLQSATTMFYVYLAALVVLCLVVVFLVIRAGWMQTLADTVTSAITPGQGV